MSKPPYYKTMSGPQTFVGRMLLFLILTGLICAIINKQIIANFDNNRPLNSLIIGVLIFGFFMHFSRSCGFIPKFAGSIISAFGPGIAIDHVPVMLAPMAMMLRRRQGQAAISTMAMRSILNSIASRLDESRETTRYLVGLLIFLGLLGTFWGLLLTTGSVGDTIAALNTEGRESGSSLPGVEGWA